MARANIIHICGPKLSICCSLISIWGIIMLAIVGGLLTIQSAAFIEDVPLEEPLPAYNATNGTTLKEAITEAYNASATNCYGAVGLYAVFLAFCGLQVWFNIKVSSTATAK